MATAPPVIPPFELPDNANVENGESAAFLSPAFGAMGSDTTDKPRRPPKSKGAPLSTFNHHMTVAAHACVLLFVILIIFYCFSGEFVFFTWHPLLLSVGWMFLITEAVLTLSKDNLFTGTLPKKVRVKLHWIFLSVAMVLVFGGFAVVYINKDDLGRWHFHTWHALFGLIGIICLIPTTLDGIGALYHGELRHYVSPKITKFLHIASGVATLIFGGLALSLSVYTKWFERKSGDNIMMFLLGLILAAFPVVWTLIKPATSCLNRLMNL